jgi:hypothetical protein
MLAEAKATASSATTIALMLRTNRGEAPAPPIQIDQSRKRLPTSGSARPGGHSPPHHPVAGERLQAALTAWVHGPGE